MAESPELLAPAGSMACAQAAVAGGADAVYVGLSQFNARARAENCSLQQLADLVAYLHGHQRRCYLTLNTLLSDQELSQALHLAAEAQRLGVDALIVQDIGLWQQLRHRLPAMPLHASTQMSLLYPSQIEVLAQWGAKRVILGRELSLPELRNCVEHAAGLGLEVEYFVHGAQCYAVSGQCFMAHFADPQRSANRGNCSQNCRFLYQQEGSSKQDSLLSLRDRCLIQELADLASAGVACCKIEGRLKDPTYVYTVTRAYAQALATWRSAQALQAQQSTRQALDPALRRVFSRPQTAALLQGQYGAEGRISQYDCSEQVVDMRCVQYDGGDSLLCAAEQAPRPGQGFRLLTTGPTGGLQLRAVEAAGPGLWRCRISAAPPGLVPGLALICNSDPADEQAARRAMAALPLARPPVSGRPLDVLFIAHPGEPPRLCLYGEDQQLIVQGDEPSQQAQTRACSEEDLRAALGTLRGSGYRLRSLRLDAAGAFVPRAHIKALRRRALAQLAAQVADQQAWQTWQPAIERLQPQIPELWVVTNSWQAAQAALSAGASQAWWDIASRDPTDQELSRVPPDLRDSGRLLLRLPPSLAELPNSAKAGLPLVCGHLGQIRQALQAGLACTADAALNVFSQASLRALQDLGARALLLSQECSYPQAQEIARCSAPTFPLAALVHGRLSAMLTRQDHGLAPGQQRHLRARPQEGGRSYQMQAYQGGYQVLWEQRRRCIPEQLAATPNFLSAWLLELGDCSPEAVAQLTKGYHRLAEGRISATELRQSIGPLYPPQDTEHRGKKKER